MSRWELVPPPHDYPHDLWAVGADLAPDTLLAAYAIGIFPMRLDTQALGWWSPRRRAVVPLAGFGASRSLRRAARKYETRIDTSFDDVVSGCANPARPGGWIDDEFRAAYGRLHRLGAAHSIEAWDEQGLAGGIYGVAIGGLFAAESMFHTRTDASKAALVGLVEHLRRAGDAEQRLLDAQWLTPHLARLGASEIPRREYHERLDRALGLQSAFP